MDEKIDKKVSVPLENSHGERRYSVNRSYKSRKKKNEEKIEPLRKLMTVKIDRKERQGGKKLIEKW